MVDDDDDDRHKLQLNIIKFDNLIFSSRKITGNIRTQHKSLHQYYKMYHTLTLRW